MIRIMEEGRDDAPARETLLNAVFGSEERQAKTCERLREGRLPADGLSFVAKDGAALIGTLRFWNVSAGPGCRAVLLGPLAVDSAYRSAGIGRQLMQVGLAQAEALGHGAVLLVGDAAYYRRFGFDTELVSRLWLPGPYAKERFMGLEFNGGALSRVAGLVNATGALAPRQFPSLAGMVAFAA